MTNSDHDLPVYPNSARNLILSGVDQLWVADLTYIRLESEFVYLAVILDAYSRRVIGWALAHTLEDSLTIAAFRPHSPIPILANTSIQNVAPALPDNAVQKEPPGSNLLAPETRNTAPLGTCNAQSVRSKVLEITRCKA